MRVEILSDPDLLPSLEKPWTDLLALSNGTVYQTYQWHRVWWRVYGAVVSMRLCTVWNDETLVGLLPCFIQNLHLGGVRIRRLSLWGEIGITGEYMPLVRPGTEQEVADQFSQFLSDELTARADVGDFHLLSYRSPFILLLKGSLRRRRVRAVLVERSLPRSVVDLPREPADYARRLPKRFRKNTGASRRLLAGAGATVERVRDPSLLPAAFDDFVRLHAATWQARGGKGYFAAKPGFEQFHRGVTAALMNAAGVELLFLRKGKDRFAALQLFTAGRIGCPYLSGRDPSHPLSQRSPGNVLLVEAIERCIEKGCTQADLMEGESDQKKWLGGKQTWYSRLTFHPSGAGAVRARLFRAALFARRMVEYAPRMGFLKGSLLHAAQRMRDRMSDQP